jgi:hypothetical protein
LPPLPILAIPRGALFLFLPPIALTPVVVVAIAIPVAVAIVVVPVSVAIVV